MLVHLAAVVAQLSLLAAPEPDPAPAPAPVTTTAPAPTDLPAAAGWSEPLAITGTLDGQTVTGTVLVYRPTGFDPADTELRYPLVVALHGWGHTAALYRDKGNLAALADRFRLIVVVPMMGKTVYETSFYPESKKRWGAIPGTRWVGEVVLPYLRAHLPVASDRAHTAVMGYSTGGRGALLLAAAYPEFAFAGSLSGTFDLMRLGPKEGEYKIHALIYGPRDRHPERWVRDNSVAPERVAGLVGTTVYAAHGAADKVVNPNQLEALREALKGTEVRAELATAEGAGHDWAFWNAQSVPLFTALARALALPIPPE